jgi:hypothetical protein
MESFPPELLLDGYPPAIRDMCNVLRGVVKRATPDAVERVRMGWHLVGYDIPVGRRMRYFAFVWPETEHAHLGFEYGIFMRDPEQILDGAEIPLKKVRFLTYRVGDTIPEDTLVPYVQEAARLATMSKAERFALELDRD